MQDPLLSHFGTEPTNSIQSQDSLHLAVDDDDDDQSAALSEDRIKNRKPFPFVLFAVGALLIAIGSAVPGRFDIAVDEAVWQQLRTDSEDAAGFASFTGMDNPAAGEDSIFLNFRLFHVENPNKKDDLTKYRIVEKGPYVYRLSLRHLNISFFGEDTGDYNRSHMKEMYFKTWQQAKLEVGPPHGGRDDAELITSLSMPYQVVLAVTKTLPSRALRDLVMGYFLGSSLKERREKMFVTKTVREHLFGYHETFESKGFTAMGDDAVYRPDLPSDVREQLVRALKPYSPRIGTFKFNPRNSKFEGFDYPGFVQNFSSPAEAMAKTEYDAQRVDRQMMHTYVWYQGSAQLKRCGHDTCPALWGTRQANRVLGSDGKFWGGKTHSENVVFLPELVRSAKVVFDGPVEVDGIKCGRWRLHPSIFGNVSAFPENAAYYANDRQPEGLFNIGPLLFDIPIYASKPRYLHADTATLLSAIEGMPEANLEEHDVTFDVHQETGISVLVNERFQYVVKLSDKVYVPIFWFETVEKMSRQHDKLFRKCDTYVKAANVLKVSGFALGICCLVLGVYIGTDRAERDAKRLQVKAVYDHTHYHRRNLHHSFDDAEDDEGEQSHPEHQGLALIMSSKSLRDGWFTTPPFVFCINIIIELVTLKKAKHVGIWSAYSAGETSAALQLVLTALFVGIFVTISGVSTARAAFVRGEVPRRALPYPPFRRRACWTLPWLPTDHACGMGVLVGIAFVIGWAGTACGLLYLFVCGSSFSADHCTLFWLVFVLLKSLFATLESAVVFPLAVLRTLDASEPMDWRTKCCTRKTAQQDGEGL